MAKKRSGFFRRARRSAGGLLRRARARGRAASKGGLMASLAAAGLYGAFRQDLAQYAQPLSSRLPFGGMSDEVVMGGLAYLGAKYGSGMVRTACLSALHVEAALAGSALRRGEMFNGGQASGSSGMQPSVNV